MMATILSTKDYFKPSILMLKDSNHVLHSAKISILRYFYSVISKLVKGDISIAISKISLI